MSKNNANNVIVLDFETTGLSPNYGDRIIEVGAVRIEDGQITDCFQSLMNPSQRINSFIESYTGITNEMLSDAPSCSKVMRRFAEFVEDFNLVAHNASFDRKFMNSEFNKINKQYSGKFACSMLIARRIYPSAPNHKLETLVSYKKIPNDGTFHRALADANMTAHLWNALIQDINISYGISDLTFNEMQELSRVSKYLVGNYFKRKK